MPSKQTNEVESLSYQNPKNIHFFPAWTKIRVKLHSADSPANGVKFWKEHTVSLNELRMYKSDV